MGRRRGCATSRPTPRSLRAFGIVKVPSRMAFLNVTALTKIPTMPALSVGAAFDIFVMMRVVNVGRPRMIAMAVDHATTVWNIDLEPLPGAYRSREAPPVVA